MFWLLVDFFSKLVLNNKKFSQEYQMSVKQLGSRSGPTTCRTCSGSKLLVKVISSQLWGNSLKNCLNMLNQVQEDKQCFKVLYLIMPKHFIFNETTNTLVNVYVDLLVFTRIAGTS